MRDLVIAACTYGPLVLVAVFAGLAALHHLAQPAKPAKDPSA